MGKKKNTEPNHILRRKDFPEANVKDITMSQKDLPDLNKARSYERIESRKESDHERVARQWCDSTPRFRLDVSYDDLLARSRGKRNKKADVQAAKAAIEEMKSWPSDPYSAIFQVSTGEALLCVFSYKAPDEGPNAINGEQAEGVNYGDYYTHYATGPRGHRGRREVDRKRSQTTTHYGFSPKDCTIWMEADQRLHSGLTPRTHARDVRHATDAKPYMAYTPGLVDGEERCEAKEFCGVTHLVHGWYAQGHTNGQLLASSDLLGRHTSANSGVVRHHITLTRTLALRLSAYFKVAFPETHDKYRRAFDAGVYFPEDPGPWIGRAVVYKLQVDPHMDGLDDGPTVAFPAGYFSGGEAYFPDLHVKLR
ncbi:hypothetical protein K474DRAFT_1707849 [Panus rudis PR-1116 ss-1]|nr:hypothetical protein K474DRAFT_1707849 [Panus rudis PR-1116 ss-1]